MAFFQFQFQFSQVSGMARQFFFAWLWCAGLTLCAVHHEGVVSHATSGNLFVAARVREFGRPLLLVDFSETAQRVPLGKEEGKGRVSLHQCVYWSVATTIFPPTDAILRLAEQVEQRKECLVVVGDKKSPQEYSFGKCSESHCVFLGEERQREFSKRFV